MFVRKEEVPLVFQEYIPGPPVPTTDLYRQACSNDDQTIKHWRDIWIRNVKANKERFGSFKDHSIGLFHNAFKNKPAIIAGSGPSLKHNAHKLKNRGDMALVSCLHNFHFLEDQEANVDFYMTLDAGPVVIEEVFEGGKKTEEEYWSMSKGKKLLAFIGTDPKLFDKWQGEVYFYAAPVPDQAYKDEIDKIELFNVHISNGGNVLGACLYFAKGFLGCNPIIFTGADFSFVNDKFHPWDSKYDANKGYAIRKTDVFGNKVWTWQSYYNFKAWFDRTCVDVPGIWINATEGGLLGAYQEGNVIQIKQMTLDEVYHMYGISDHPAIVEMIKDPTKKDVQLLF